MAEILQFPKQSVQENTFPSLKGEIIRGLDIIEKAAESRDPKTVRLRVETANRIIEAIRNL